MTDPNTAQATLLIAALEDQLAQMVPKLAQAERDAGHGQPDRARTIRLDAAQLLRDVTHAQFLITQLKRRFPAADFTVSTLVAECP